MRKLAVLFLLILAIAVNISCASDEEDLRIKDSLKEAGETLGIEIPRPHYLPEGYEIKNVFVSDNSGATLLISNNEKKLIELEVMWRPEGIIPYRIHINGPTVKFDGFTGQLIESGETKIGVVWNWYPERYKPGLIILKLSAPKDMPEEELTSIAGSVDF